MSMHDNPLRHLTERYRLARILRSASSSTVYTARAPDTNERVVVKVIAREELPPAWGWHERFEPAMSAVRLLALPTLPRIVEAGWLSEREAFLVAAVAEGEGLDVAPRPAPGVALAVLAQLARALRALHEAGTAHLNIAPGNILIKSGNEDTTPTLIGLGTGWLRPSGVDRESAAPELARRGGVPDPRRCDVYSFARTLCSVLDVTVRWKGDGPPDLGVPEGVAALVGHPETFSEVVARALSRASESRLESLDRLAEALDGAVAVGAQEPPGDQAPPVAPVESAQATKRDLDDTAKIRITAIARPPSTGGSDRGTAPMAEPAGPSTLDDTVHVDAPSLRVALERHRRGRGDPGGPAPDETQPTEPPVGSEPAAELDRTIRVSLPSMSGAGMPRREAQRPQPSDRKGGTGFAPIHMTGPVPWSKRPLVWGIAASLSFTLAVVLLLSLGGEHRPAARRATGAASTAVPASVTESPPPSPTPDLLSEAESAFAAGDFARAENLLDNVIRAAPDDISRDDRARIAALHRSLTERRQWDRIRELDDALRSGDLVRLRRSVDTFASGQPAAADNSVEVQRKLALARSIIDSDDHLQDAERRGRWAEVLERAATILVTLPNCTTAAVARERAATELEIGADALAREGDPAAAIERLAPLRRWWPDRPELDTRIASYTRLREQDELTGEAIQRAENEGREGRPEAGLGILAELAPQPRFAGAVSSLQARLRAELERLDAGSPVVTPMSGTDEEYEKDRPIRIVLRVEDDYRVVAVTVFARSEDASSFARFVAVGANGDVYAANIPPEFHQNRTLQYYAVATDASGHRGALGSPAQPLELRRKRWRPFRK